MKRFAAALLCLAMCGTFETLAAKELKWGNDLKAAAGIAGKQKKKNILLFFTAPGWCGPCRRLESGAMVSAGFKKIAEQAVLVKMDFSDRNKVTAAMNEAGRQFKLEGFPTLIVLDAAGKEKGRIVGFLPEKRYIADLNKLVNGK